MSQEHLSSPSSINSHLQSLAQRLSSVPELHPVIETIESDPAHASAVYGGYLDLSTRMVNLSVDDIAVIQRSQAAMSGEIGSASTVGANNLVEELQERQIDLSSVVAGSFDQRSPYYQPAVDEVVTRMEGGHAMKIAGKTPSDHDSESLKVIWGHTVITGGEALLHFTSMHYLERYVSKALADQDISVASQKDFFINAMTDVVILNGLAEPDDPTFRLWVAPKDEGGMGWITPDRLRSYIT